MGVMFHFTWTNGSPAAGITAFCTIGTSIGQNLGTDASGNTTELYGIPDGYTTWTVSYNGTNYNGVFTVDSAVAQPQVINVTLTGGGGGGTTATLQGVVRNSSTGVGIIGATVTVNGASVSTGTGGAYTVPNITPRSAPYTITASASGYTTASQQIQMASATTYTANFDLVAGGGGGGGGDAGNIVVPIVIAAVAIGIGYMLLKS